MRFTSSLSEKKWRGSPSSLLRPQEPRDGVSVSAVTPASASGSRPGDPQTWIRPLDPTPTIPFFP